MKRQKLLIGGLKDIDEKGVVTFYFSAFGNRDSDGDITLPGAFKKTFSENKERVRHFKNHDSRLTPGVVKELGEDTFGAWARSQLILGTQLGRDTYEEYKAGAIKEHSFGFEYTKWNTTEDPGTRERTRTVSEYKLWEVSSLNSWGANPLTYTVDVKSEKDLIEYFDVLLSLQKGQFSDEYLKTVELKIKQIEQHIKTLNTTTPKEPGDKPFSAVEFLSNNLKF
jgi:HK97 family phage prohead protease